MDLAFYRNLVVLNGLIPIIILAWDGWRGNLGANAVNNALHITGILSLVFIFLSLLITPLRNLSGWNSIIAYRRALGLYGFFYALIHFAIYIALDRQGDLRSAFNEIITRRYLTIGLFAVMLMLPLAVTSTNAMIRRLGASRWKLLHRLAYVAAGLGVLHYYMLVKSDVRQPLVFAGVLTPLLGYRFINHYVGLRKTAANAASRKPPIPSSRTTASPGKSGTAPRRSLWNGELVVAQVHRESPDVKTFRLVADQGVELPFQHAPGQYLTLTVPIEGQPTRRSYTIASTPSQRGHIEISVKRDPHGAVSKFLHDDLRVGDRLAVAAPAGKFHFDGKGENRVLLIAGGIGITPVMAMLRFLTDRVWDGTIDLVYVTRTDRDVVFGGELHTMVQRFTNIRVHHFVTRQANHHVTAATIDEAPLRTIADRWDRSIGYPDADAYRRILGGRTDAPVFLCGPESMMSATRETLASIGMANDRIATEAFVSRAPPIETTSTDRGAMQPVDEEETRSRVHDHLGYDASAPERIVTVSTANGLGESHVALSEIVFKDSDTALSVDGAHTVLEAAELAGVAIGWECRSGICGQCKVKCTEGRVEMDVTDALSRNEQAAGLILSCQARPLTQRVVVEA
jgi:glycine betaine catabolism B